MSRIIRIIIIVLVVGAIIWFAAMTALRDRFMGLYTHRLDDWAHRGGPVQTVQNDVVTNCGKFVLTEAGPINALWLSMFDREEFDFRVDVCSKITINRVHPQPEFQNPEIVRSLCGSQTALYRRLCEISGVKDP
jgi:hypothetical protein